MLPLQIEPGIHLAFQLGGLLGIKLELLTQSRKLRAEVVEFNGDRGQPVGQWLAGGIDAFNVPCLPQQRGQFQLHAILSREPGLERLGELDQELERVEYRHALRPLLDALPERERTILMLRFFGGQTQSEIARQIGISQMHVSRVLAATLARLRRELDDER